MRVHNDDFSIAGSHSAQIIPGIYFSGEEKRAYLQGCVHTPNGTVAVTSTARMPAAKSSTRLDMAANGRHLIRTIWGKAYTKRGLVTLAKRWAKEVNP